MMDKKKAKKYGKLGVVIGKKIIIEGSKVLVVSAFGLGLNVFLSKGVVGLKTLTLNDWLDIEEKPAIEEPKS